MSLHLERCGDRGPPLVLLHGWGFSSAVWEPLTADLARSFSLYLVDLPGHGGSRDPLPDETPAEVAREIQTLVPPSAGWIGWSLGGLVALSAALGPPPGPRAILLVAATPRFLAAPDWPHGVPGPTLSGFARDLREDLQGTLGRFLALQTRGARRGAETARVLRRVLRQGPPPRPTGLARGLSWLRETDLRPELRRVSCPVSVLLGERDTLVPPACLDDLLTLRPDWGGSVVPGAGHAPFLLDPEDFTRSVADWSSRGA
ncbi:MAG: pimeloyl-ACP methyl ester esterase BioH [Gammaproteobacteria bacterium]|nr:pimeloyl-ACP methyl ester esterase BioH [Gammaproteobacteria bacterium]